MKLRAVLFSCAVAFPLVACAGVDDETQGVEEQGASSTDELQACVRLRPGPPVVCPAVVDPVCGCDGKTYTNKCVAGRFITHSTPGACEDTAPTQCRRARPLPTLCPHVYSPVCGCDGNTYGNACEAARAVTSWSGDACM